MRRGLTIYVVAAAAFLCASAGASPASAKGAANAPAAGLADAKALIAAECQAGRLSGIMAILLDGREIAFHACGRTVYPNGPQITRQTRFKLFSTSKQFTATAIVRLASRGVLSLDDRIGQWLPDAPKAWQAATVRQLLMHKAGIPNDVDGYVKGYRADAAGAITAWFAAMKDHPTDFVPGAQYRYSNMGYELLALIAERATKQSWPEILSAEVLQPANMRTAFLEAAAIKDGEATGPARDPMLAQGYVGAPGALEAATSFAFVLRGSGALHAKLADLEAYERALLKGQPLGAALQASMYDQPRNSYALGWVVHATPAGNIVINHSGGTNGFSVDYARVPARRLAVILLNNFGFSDVEDYRKRIVDLLDPRDPAPAPGQADQAPASRLHDLMPSYWRFAAAATKHPEAAQQAWTRDYYAPNRAVLADLQCSLLASGKLPPARTAELARIEPGMRAATAALRRDLPGALARFDRALPDNRWHGDIYLLVSLGCFDGRAQSIGGKPAMLLGADVLAATGNRAPAVLLTHELFHLYHRQFFQPEGDPIWASLWSEGLATYASGELNPGASLEALLLPRALVDAVDKDRARLAADLAAHLDESGTRAETLYFRTDDRTEPVPPRAGYYLGLLAVRELAGKGYSLTDMAHWNAETARERVQQALAVVGANP